MKRFHFRLERLLELRAYREREWLAKLAEATGRCVKLGRRIRENASQAREAFKSPYLSQQVVDLQLLAYREHYLTWLEAQRRRLEQELAERQSQRREVQKKYLEVSKERKVLEKLKERRAADYYAQSRAEEFKLMDESSSSQYTRGLLERAEE